MLFCCVLAFKPFRWCKHSKKASYLCLLFHSPSFYCKLECIPVYVVVLSLDKKILLLLCDTRVANSIDLFLWLNRLIMVLVLICFRYSFDCRCCDKVEVFLVTVDNSRQVYIDNVKKFGIREKGRGRLNITYACCLRQ